MRRVPAADGSLLKAGRHRCVYHDSKSDTKMLPFKTKSNGLLIFMSQILTAMRYRLADTRVHGKGVVPSLRLAKSASVGTVTVARRLHFAGVRVYTSRIEKSRARYRVG